MAKIYAHVTQRARERYDLHVEPIDIKSMNEVIRAGAGRRIGKGKRGADKYLLTWLGGQEIGVVYHHKKGTVVTMLPANAREIYRYVTKRGSPLRCC